MNNLRYSVGQLIVLVYFLKDNAISLVDENPSHAEPEPASRTAGLQIFSCPTHQVPSKL